MRYYLYQPLSGSGQSSGDRRMRDDRPKVVNVLTALREGCLIFRAFMLSKLQVLPM